MELDNEKRVTFYYGFKEPKPTQYHEWSQKAQQAYIIMYRKRYGPFEGFRNKEKAIKFADNEGITGSILIEHIFLNEKTLQKRISRKFMVHLKF